MDLLEILFLDIEVVFIEKKEEDICEFFMIELLEIQKLEDIEIVIIFGEDQLEVLVKEVIEIEFIVKEV